MNQTRKLYLSLFIITAFLLALVLQQNSSLRWIDAQMFHLASYLLPAPTVSTSLRVIQLDEARMQTPEGIQEFRSLLNKLNKAKAAEVVWLTDDFPRMDYMQDNEKNDDANKVKTKKKSAKKSNTKNKRTDNALTSKKVNGDATIWKPAIGERNKLAWMLEKQNVFLTQYSNMPGRSQNITYTESLIFSTGWRQYIPELLLPTKQTFLSTQINSPYRIYPFADNVAGQNTLIWYAESERKDMKTASMPDLSLAIFSEYQKNTQLSWSESGVASLGAAKISAGLTGQVYHYFSNLTDRHTQPNVSTLSQAKKKSNRYFKNKIIIVGQNENQLQQLADSISSIDSGAVYFTPAHSWWILPAIMFVVMIYLIWLLPMLSKPSGVFLGAFILLAIVTAQLLLLISRGMWWPIANLLFLLISGHIAVYIYLSAKKVLNELLEKQQFAWFQLGHYQYEKGDYETAITSLLKCRANEEALSDIYEIGLSFERKRQYDKAMQLYSEINIRQKNYKDIDKRLNSMSGFSETKAQILSPTQAQKTLVMPEMELPEFGRYKIERELGRGAMGVVYLGKDPKINRKVAIKTLDYTQFDKTELKTVKSRFFREAEAAGRLSHNNIVTVYDVGEEPDFAFIAMDYVEGVPLSDFTKKNTLLPVRDVYHILQVVAEALNYAHAQNIVHRDIKPGNIMYNPQDKQIKITDFGIARITDSVKTRTGSFMGSPSYMAPEQMTGTSVNGQADLYSLGVSMYQLLTGVLPFDADSLGNLAYKITNEKHVPIRDIRADLPASATRIINKALQKEKQKRFANGAEMAAALKKGAP